MLRLSAVRRPGFRRVYVNQQPCGLDDEARPAFSTNHISTSKYTILTFIPKNLFEQFRRVANIFFLTLAILQFFPDYMIINPVVAALPFIVIIAVTMIKDGVEDMRRHSSDRQINGQPTRILDYPNRNLHHHRARNDKKISPTSHEWQETNWGFVAVGDVVLLRKDDPIPADILILNTSEDGLCYTETKNLDGETNLKIRKGLLEMEGLDKDSMGRFVASCSFYVDSEKPNPNLYTYTGTAVFDSIHAGKDGNEVEKRIRVPLTINSILLRGCILRNTDWVIGLVLYTGQDTKICLNAGATPSKQSKIEKLMNPQIIINLLLLVLLCIVNCTASPLWESAHLPSAKSLSISWLASTFRSGSTGGSDSLSSFAWIGFTSFWQSLIAFQNIVPISLYITIEIVKTAQSYFIYNDAEMYYESLDQPCIPKSWNLTDDLGQIDYIFSDKTGTLTRNIMQFKKCTVNGVVYGEGEHSDLEIAKPSVAPPPVSLTEIAKKRRQITESQSKHPVGSPLKRNGFSSDEPNQVGSDSNLPLHSSTLLDQENLKFIDPQLSRELANVGHVQYAALRDFFTTLAVCHSVLISKDQRNPEGHKYNAQSPDEAALVQAARDVGFVFNARGSSSLTVDVLGEEEVSELLNVIEFNSTRKRMSVIVRRPAGEIVLYCKGADSVIYDRLAPGQDIMKQVTSEHLEEFAEDGLRTLCIAYAILPVDEYDAWAQEYNAASTSLEDREQKMDLVAEAIEKNLILMGATAIEDKLQEGVPECIQTILSAGIKLWVLTGDKMETAINIGLSCNLLTKDMNLILIRGSDNSSDAVEQTRQELGEALDKFFGVSNPHAPMGSKKGERRFFKQISKISRNEPYALVIDGVALKHALQDEQKQLFLELATRCAAVICCRVSPLQKAQVVELVKNSVQCMCLAIGDGANDVSMIQAAHIGIGIAGEEGLQAVMASDYAIAQFRFLSRLLLVHGHWSSIRTAEMILNFFFKNIVWVMPLFWYQIFCGFSSQMVYDQSYMLFYNLILTSLPVIIIGIFDVDVPQEFLQSIPPLYTFQKAPFGLRRFAIYMFDAMFQSLAFFFISLWAWPDENTVDANGRPWGLGDWGNALAIGGVLIANLQSVMNMNSWTIVSGGLMATVFVILILFSLIYSNSSISYEPGLFIVMYPRASFWLTMGLQLVTCLLPRLVLLYVQRIIWPTNIQIMQEVSKMSNATITPELQRMKSDMTENKRVSLAQIRRTSIAAPTMDSRKESAMRPLEALSTFSVTSDASTAVLRDSILTTSPPPDVVQTPPTALRVNPNAPVSRFGHSVSEYRMPDLDSGLMSATSLQVPYSMAQELRTPATPEWRSSMHDMVVQDSMGGLAVMKTGQLLRNRGYSFSQSEGARDIIMGRRRTELDNILLGSAPTMLGDYGHGRVSTRPALRTSAMSPNGIAKERSRHGSS